MEKAMNISYLESAILDILKQGKEAVVIISGRSCSGKTTLANYLAGKFKRAKPLILNQDNWYKDIQDMPDDGYGHKNLEVLESYHKDEFKNDVIRLLQTGFIEIPEYNIERNIRVSKNRQCSRGILTIIEGLHSGIIFQDLDKNSEIRLNMELLYVYVSTPLETCIDRRVKRDTIMFHVNQDLVRRYYISIVENSFLLYDSRLIRLMKEKGKFGMLIKGDSLYDKTGGI